MDFATLGLSAPLVRAVATQGYSIPTSVQQQAIPAVINGRDLVGCSQTGTGKTAAFALPILHRLSSASPIGKKRRQIRALILSPTRELAAQIAKGFERYGSGSGLRTAVIYGGVNQNPQVNALRRGVDILVATPGRLLDLYEQGFVDFSGVEIVVLDEADHMLDMGFLPDVRRIMKLLPQPRQTLLFSATMPPAIRELAKDMLDKPVAINVAPQQASAERIEQGVYHVAQPDKAQLLEHLFTSRPQGSSLVFVRTKHGADKLAKILNQRGLRAEAIHGNKSQNARQRTLDAFRSGKLSILVATDVASRGIDVRGIRYVINFDCPETPETYVHRIGRTARAGDSGNAVTFCSPAERGLMRDVERLLKYRLPICSVELPKVRKAPREMLKPTSQTRKQPRHAADTTESLASPKGPSRFRRFRKRRNPGSSRTRFAGSR